MTIRLRTWEPPCPRRPLKPAGLEIPTAQGCRAYLAFGTLLPYTLLQCSSTSLEAGLQSQWYFVHLFVEVGWCSKRQVKGMVCWWLTQPWCHCSSSLPTCSPSPCSRVATRLVLLLVSQKTNKKNYSSILAWLVLEIFCGFCASQA